MELNFQGEVLTPLFLGGADTRGNPELRAPSFRGVLRYWFRALLSGSQLVITNSANELEILKREESRVFGSTEGRSSVSVLVTPDGKPTVTSFQKERAIRTPEGDFLPTGKDYLLWSMVASGRPEDPARYRPACKYIEPGSRFRISLRTSFCEHEVIKKASAALWLMGNLGAIGARANRGAGSFQVAIEDNTLNFPVYRACRSLEELQSFLCEGILQCLQAVTGEATNWRTFDHLPLYDILSPNTAEVWIVADNEGGWNSYQQALNGVGEKFRDFRNHRAGIGKKDHDAVLEWLAKGGEGPEIQRAVFGLPLPFRYSQGGPGDVIQPSNSTRRASPLKIRITRLTTGSYVGVLVLFKSRFLEEDAKLQLQTRKLTAPSPKDYSIIHDFMQTFPVKRGVFGV